MVYIYGRGLVSEYVINSYNSIIRKQPIYKKYKIFKFPKRRYIDSI